MTLSAMRRLPVPIPADLPGGLIDRAGTPMAKLTVALIAIHGLGKKETTLLLLDDLGLSRGHLLVRRPAGRHTVCLDELSRALATSWLSERHGPPVALTVMDAIFGKLSLSPSRLRQDRILDEARRTADPVHLMRVFGLTAKPTMNYVQAAHPERRPTMPR